jgi:hypothetical protein
MQPLSITRCTLASVRGIGVGVWAVADFSSTSVTQTVVVRAKSQRHYCSVTGNGPRTKLWSSPLIPSSSRSPTVRPVVHLRLPARGALSQPAFSPPLIQVC